MGVQMTDRLNPQAGRGNRERARHGARMLGNGSDGGRRLGAGEPHPARRAEHVLWRRRGRAPWIAREGPPAPAAVARDGGVVDAIALHQPEPCALKRRTFHSDALGRREAPLRHASGVHGWPARHAAKELCVVMACDAGRMVPRHRPDKGREGQEGPLNVRSTIARSVARRSLLPTQYLAQRFLIAVQAAILRSLLAKQIRRAVDEGRGRRRLRRKEKEDCRGMVRARRRRGASVAHGQVEAQPVLEGEQQGCMRKLRKRRKRILEEHCRSIGHEDLMSELCSPNR